MFNWDQFKSDRRLQTIILLFIGSAAVLSIGDMMLSRRNILGIEIVGFGVWYLFKTVREWTS